MKGAFRCRPARRFQKPTWTRFERGSRAADRSTASTMPNAASGREQAVRRTGRSSPRSGSTGRSSPQPALPCRPSKTTGWSANPIDAFLAAAMEAKGVKPSAPADRRTLIRRAYLDMLGLPPAPEEVEAFVADKSPGAWETVVDRCSPRRTTASAGRVTGWTWCATRIREDSSSTRIGRRRIAIAITWSSRSTATSRTTNSSRSSSPATSTRRTSNDAMVATGFLRLGPGGGNRQDAGGRPAEHDVAHVHGR